jgi:exodeoxyribonuclease VII large subunit
VRAIANSRIPIISGIGHETDVTLADFAADLRAPTPTAAAEQAVPEKESLQEELAGLSARLGHGLQLAAAAERSRLSELNSRLERVSPSWQMRSDLQRLDELGLRLGQGMQNAMQRRWTEIRHIDRQLSGISPYAVLQRGFAIVTDLHGEIVTRVGQVDRDDVVDIRVSDGSFLSRVITDENKDGEVQHG